MSSVLEENAEFGTWRLEPFHLLLQSAECGLESRKRIRPILPLVLNCGGRPKRVDKRC